MSKHLKRLNAPRTIKLHRKEKKWTIKSSPGPHPLEKSIPLGLIIRNYLGLCDTYKEAKRALADGDVLVDGVKRKSHSFPCGLMDVISIPKLKKNYRVLFDQKGKLTLVAINEKEAEWKLCRIEDKTVVKGKKTQIHLHDGKNIIVKKDAYRTGDVLKVSNKDNKITDVFKFDKGSISLIIGGSHVGQIANIEDIKIVQSSKPNLATMKGKNEFSTITHYVFPIGKTKSIVTLPEVKI
jgi:small subunit ribosomal protein S4e